MNLSVLKIFLNFNYILKEVQSHVCVREATDAMLIVLSCSDSATNTILFVVELFLNTKNKQKKKLGLWRMSVNI